MDFLKKETKHAEKNFKKISKSQKKILKDFKGH